MNEVNCSESELSDLLCVVDSLRGQLQNCVNHLERAKRRSYGQEQRRYEEAIESANKALYETLNT
jgi:hypothetical protein